MARHGQQRTGRYGGGGGAGRYGGLGAGQALVIHHVGAGRHGLVGYEVMDPDRGELLNELRWHPDTDPLRWQPHPTVFQELAARGVQAVEIVDLALEDHGGAVSAAEILAREEALRPLERAGRRALVAAGSPEVWPPA